MALAISNCKGSGIIHCTGTGVQEVVFTERHWVRRVYLHGAALDTECVVYALNGKIVAKMYAFLANWPNHVEMQCYMEGMRVTIASGEFFVNYRAKAEGPATL
jgi:hypothetical protein